MDRIVGGVLLLAMQGAVAQGQQPTEGSCPPCTVQIRHFADVSNATFDWVTTVHIDGHGRIATVVGHTPHELLVFDSTASGYVTIGNAGEGPGEYRDISLVLSKGENLYLFDRQLHRLSVLTSDLELKSATPLPAAPLNAAIWKDSVVINAAFYTQNLAGYPFHVLTDSGTIARSFGYDTIPFRVDVPFLMDRAMTVCPTSGDLWTAPYREYALSQYGQTGSQRAIRRDVPWFRPHAKQPTFQPGEPPPPILRALSCDTHGYLWVLIQVADPEWQKALVERAQPNAHGRRFTISDQDRYFDTILEVIDTRTGTILASSRSDYLFAYFPAPGTVGVYREASDGQPLLRLWRTALTPRRR